MTLESTAVDCKCWEGGMMIMQIPCRNGIIKFNFLQRPNKGAYRDFTLWSFKFKHWKLISTYYPKNYRFYLLNFSGADGSRNLDEKAACFTWSQIWMISMPLYSNLGSRYTKTHRSLNLHIAQVKQAVFLLNNSDVICFLHYKSWKVEDTVCNFQFLLLEFRAG